MAFCLALSVSQETLDGPLYFVGSVFNALEFTGFRAR